jgi:dihydroorotase
MNKLTITRPDDWHLHFRDGGALKTLVPDTAKRFARAIVMPNLRPPITSTQLAIEYRQRILDAVPDGVDFEPLMTLYLTDNTSAEEIAKAKESGFVQGVKLYPAGATTNSDSGVTNLDACTKALEAMQKFGIPLLIHAEVTDANVDVFDRERVFIDRHLKKLLARYPSLKIVLEHITTKDAS